MCMWIEEFAKTYGMGVGDEGGVYIYIYGQKFAKTCGMGVGGEGGVYIYVYVDRSGDEGGVYIYMDRRVR